MRTTKVEKLDAESREELIRSLGEESEAIADDIKRLFQRRRGLMEWRLRLIKERSEEER